MTDWARFLGVEFAEVVDLFAGPGGWDVAAEALGLMVAGIEFDATACETRRAALLATIEGDVRHYGPHYFPAAYGLIASPPCQTFSTAGKGSGRQALNVVTDLAVRMSYREAIDLSVFEDERTALVLEPLRWALEAIDLGRPYEWLAFEQVPTVLPVWQLYAEILREEGYSVATGTVSAEQYGVPQTRKRALLVARRHGQASLPIPTHRLYKKGVAQSGGDQSLQSWVSMAEALGWGMTRRPYPTIATGTGAGGGTDPQCLGGSGARRTVRQEYEAGYWLDRVNDQSGTPVDLSWPANRPATTVATRELIQHPGATANRHNGSTKSRNDDIRVTVEEAATLQSFPDGYPWQGKRTKKFQQVGNAVPPLLAYAVLEPLVAAMRDSMQKAV